MGPTLQNMYIHTSGVDYFAILGHSSLPRSLMFMNQQRLWRFPVPGALGLGLSSTGQYLLGFSPILMLKSLFCHLSGHHTNGLAVRSNLGVSLHTLGTFFSISGVSLSVSTFLLSCVQYYLKAYHNSPRSIAFASLTIFRASCCVKRPPAWLSGLPTNCSNKLFMEAKLLVLGHPLPIWGFLSWSFQKHQIDLKPIPFTVGFPLSF